MKFVLRSLYIVSTYNIFFYLAHWNISTISHMDEKYHKPFTWPCYKEELYKDQRKIIPLLLCKVCMERKSHIQNNIFIAKKNKFVLINFFLYLHARGKNKLHLPILHRDMIAKKMNVYTDKNAFQQIFHLLFRNKFF